MPVTYFSVYTCWLIQKGYYYNYFPTAPRDEKVATWYLDMLLFEHFSLRPKNPANSEIAFNTWLPPGLKEIAGTQRRYRQAQYAAHSAAWLGGKAAACLGSNC